MILDAHSTLRTVFTVYAAVWTGVLVILFIATPLLLKRAEALRKRNRAGHH